jgi:hypothetical protein
MGYSETEEEAVDAWNNRADLPATNAQASANEKVKALVGVLEYLDQAGGLGLEKHKLIRAALASMETRE